MSPTGVVRTLTTFATAAVLALCACAGSDDAGDSGDGGATSEEFYEVCEAYWQFMADDCLDDPVDPLETCQAIATLGNNSGCMDEYEAQLACIGEHQSDWSCEPDYCTSEASAAFDCVKPYCEEHPGECDQPPQIPWADR